MATICRGAPGGSALRWVCLCSECQFYGHGVLASVVQPSLLPLDAARHYDAYCDFFAGVRLGRRETHRGMRASEWCVLCGVDLPVVHTQRGVPAVHQACFACCRYGRYALVWWVPPCWGAQRCYRPALSGFGLTAATASCLAVTLWGHPALPSPSCWQAACRRGPVPSAFVALHTHTVQYGSAVWHRCASYPTSRCVAHKSVRAPPAL